MKPNRTVASIPKLARQWHPVRNGALRADQVSAGSYRKIWWRCDRDREHEWEAFLNNRVKGSGCPFCANKRVCATNSLAHLRPDLAAQWHPVRNGALGPADVTPGSNKKVWWYCPQAFDHEWRAAVHYRTNHSEGCPFCSGHKVALGNSLAVERPDVAAEWHPSRNGSLHPEDLRTGSDRLVWWRCGRKRAHVWQARVYSRTSVGQGCPFCSGNRVTPERSVARVSRSVARQWHPSKNGDLTPRDVSYSSGRPVWWKCPKGPDHEWQASPNQRLGGGREMGCPFCGGKRTAAAQSLAARHPKLAREWHPSRNGALLAREVLPGSDKSVWWRCSRNQDHEWRTTVCSRGIVGSGCPFCAGSCASPDYNLAAVAPHLVPQWHPTKNGSLTPFDVTPGAIQRVWWKCPEGPDHEWQVSPNTRTSRQTGCPFCSGRRVSVTNSLATRFPAIAAEWDFTRNKGLGPADVTAGSANQVWWRCTAGHVWKAQVHARTRRGRGCPVCSRPRKRKQVTRRVVRERVWLPSDFS